MSYNMTNIRICQICGCARKTFICFALSNGMPPNVVMKYTITESAKKDAIKKMEEAFKKK